MERGDRGLLGMKLDPEYPAEPFIYVTYTYDAPIGGPPPPGPPYPFEGDYCEEVAPYEDCLASGRIASIEVEPATGVAVGGFEDPPQNELVWSWCTQFTSHSMGDIEFDSSGALLAGGGDGADWSLADNGQFNACGDRTWRAAPCEPRT